MQTCCQNCSNCDKNKHRNDEDKKNLIRRLNRVEGQVRGINKMIEEKTKELTKYENLDPTDYENEELTRFFFAELKKYAKTQKAICVKFDPLVIYNAFALKDVENRKTYDHKTIELLKSMGIHHYGYNLDMHDATQPRTQAVFYFYEN